MRFAQLALTLAPVWLLNPTPPAHALEAEGQQIAEAAPELRLEHVLNGLELVHPKQAMAETKRAQAEAKVLSAQGIWDPYLAADAYLLPAGYYERGTLESSITQLTPLRGMRVSGGYRLGSGDFPTYYGEQATGDGGEVWAAVGVPLMKGGPTDAGRTALAQAAIDGQIAADAVDLSLLELSRDAAYAYYSWVAAGQRLTIERELLALAQARDGQIEQRVQRGDLPPIDRVDNQQAMLKREQGVISAQRSVERAALKLSLYVRDAQGRPRVPLPAELPSALVAPEAPAMGVDQAVEAGLLQRPEVSQARASIQWAQAQVRYATNLLSPQVDLSLAASKDLAAPPELAPGELKVGLKVGMPALRREARGKAAQAEADLSRLRIEQRWLEEQIATQIADAYSALDAAQKKVQVAEREVAAARQLAEAERDRLALGQGTLLVLNLREQTAADANRRLVDARAEHAAAWADVLTVTAAWPHLGQGLAAAAP